MPVSYAWDDDNHTVTLSGSGTALFSSIRGQDRADHSADESKQHLLYGPYTCSGSGYPELPTALDYPVRPCDDIAIQLRVKFENIVADGILTIGGTDFSGAAQSETIDTSTRGSADPWTVVTTKKYRTAWVQDDGYLAADVSVRQNRWGIMGYFQYPGNSSDWVLQGCIIVGAGVTFLPTSFQSYTYQLYMSCPTGYSYQTIIRSTGGVVRFGTLKNLATKSVSTLLHIVGSGAPYLQNMGGYLHLYGTVISASPSSTFRITSTAGSETRVWGCALGPGVDFIGSGFDIFDLHFVDSGTFIDATSETFQATIDKVTLTNVLGVIWGWFGVPSDVTVANLYARNCTYMVSHVSGLTPFSSVYTFIDADVETWNFFFNAYWTGKVWRKHTLRVHAQDKYGNALSEVSAVGEYLSPFGQAFSATTDAFGDIPVQTIDYCWFEQATGNEEQPKCPLKVTFSKPGYQTVLKYYLMDEKTKDRVVLLPEPIPLSLHQAKAGSTKGRVKGNSTNGLAKGNSTMGLAKGNSVHGKVRASSIKGSAKR